MQFKLVRAYCVTHSRSHSCEGKVLHACFDITRSIPHALTNASIAKAEVVRPTHTRWLVYFREGPRSRMSRSPCAMILLWCTPCFKATSVRPGGWLCRNVGAPPSRQKAESALRCAQASCGVYVRVPQAQFAGCFVRQFHGLKVFRGQRGVGQACGESRTHKESARRRIVSPRRRAGEPGSTALCSAKG